MAFRARSFIVGAELLVALGGFMLQPVAKAEEAGRKVPQISFPKNYRNWIYLSSGFDMSYSASATPEHHMFDNVFVNRQAYEAFRKTGAWPDQTTLVLEVRGAQEKGSINQHGAYQASLMSVEVHKKDSRFPDGWGFFQFRGDEVSRMLPRSAECYSCHASHGAKDTTFVQFYPTLGLSQTTIKTHIGNGP